MTVLCLSLHLCPAGTHLLLNYGSLQFFFSMQTAASLLLLLSCIPSMYGAAATEPIDEYLESEYRIPPSHPPSRSPPPPPSFLPSTPELSGYTKLPATVLVFYDPEQAIRQETPPRVFINGLGETECTKLSNYSHHLSNKFSNKFQYICNSNANFEAHLKVKRELLPKSNSPSAPKTIFPRILEGFGTPHSPRCSARSSHVLC